MSFFPTTVKQLMVEQGHKTPTAEVIKTAQSVITKDCHNRWVAKLPPRADDFGYDIECYPNFFSFSAMHIATGQRWLFEISEWKNEGLQIHQFLMYLSQHKCRLVGYNNNHYDYPMIHMLIEASGRVTYQDLYQKSQAIFADHTGWGHAVWDNQQWVKQVDLMKIHHFDNKAKMTSLKMLEFNMRSQNIRDLPYDPKLPVTRSQADDLLTYNDHDVDETVKFYFQSLPQLIFRDELSIKYNRNFTNHNDGKIGNEYFLMELEKNNIKASKYVQTIHTSIKLADVVFNYVSFEHPEFNRILDFFRGQTINPEKIKGFFKDLNATIDDFQFDFGAGGIHGSLKSTIVRSSETHILLDWDVASYYPNLAIANRLFPAHLKEIFCDIYLDVYHQRKGHAKGSPENAMLKLALNVIYGNSNNKHSPFFDTQYTLAITINGQLLLCMLAEQLMKIPDLTMVQINTDGLTFLCPREYRDHANSLFKWWEELTKLELEEAVYDSMYIRDVNSYLAKTDEGKIKRIGAYASETAIENPATRELPWHKNHGAIVVAKAAEAALVRGVNIETFIRGHKDPFDFMLRTKVPRNSSLELRSSVYWGDTLLTEKTEVLQNICRYYPATQGGRLVKIMTYTEKQLEKWRSGDHYQHEATGDYKVVDSGKKPPSGRYKPVVNTSPFPHDREIGISVGYLVKECNDMKDYDPSIINYDYYINETRKLVDPLLLGEIKR